MLRCSIPGQPIGKGRPRVSTRGGFARAYTPAKTANWEMGAADLLRHAWGGKPTLDEPVVLLVRAVGRRPKAMLGKKHPEGRIYRTTKPDGDNVLKAVADSLKNAGVIRDDTLVVHWVCTSLYAAKSEGPCVEVELAYAPEIARGLAGVG